MYLKTKDPILHSKENSYVTLCVLCGWKEFLLLQKPRAQPPLRGSEPPMKAPDSG
jgi:hypothetical protein